MVFRSVVVVLCLVHFSLAVKVKVVMDSDEDSAPESDKEVWQRRNEATLLPFVKHQERVTTAKPRPHPNDMLFPLIYRQKHINSMFKFGENWYTWSTERRTDGSKEVNYYVCNDEPKHCDDVGWERIEAVPKCALQIESVADDRACIRAFGAEPRADASTSCDASQQMKVSELVRRCGSRVHSLWRFTRVGRRAPATAKPADVNALLCDDEDECNLTLEYRIHHDRITFSLHEPSRGQTFKSVIKRDTAEEKKPTERTVRLKNSAKRTKVHLRDKPEDGDESRYRPRTHSQAKRREHISEDMSQ